MGIVLLVPFVAGTGQTYVQNWNMKGKYEMCGKEISGAVNRWKHIIIDKIYIDVRVDVRYNKQDI